MPLTILDDRLLDLIDPEYTVERISSGHVFTEGPVWHHRDRHITFSDVQEQVMYRWTEAEGVSVFRDPSNDANGNTYDHQGRLVTCEDRSKRVTRTALDGTIEVIAERFGTARLNEPNDLICAPNGDIIFTDPTFGMRDAHGVVHGQEYPFSGVFRIAAADGALYPLVETIAWPNGLAITGDGRTLYLDDSFERLVYAFDLAPDGAVAAGRIFARLEHDHGDLIPDGMKLDALGNLYVAPNSHEGIWVYAPDGTLLGVIGFPEEQSIHKTGPGGVANLAWGDDDWQTIYATAVTSVYRLRTKVPGQPVLLS